ncbi:MAG TPA: phosphate/phosphite/phosphonate ABC transporter substrate-binding protein [bacterium]|nr:phosphate/phosphite/phosphonate ABC transporter substrate-binding protein [Myxococcales bacterium]OQA61071.1 MAG: Phosphate-import protein PhnD precursor [bacterium ADurb.Bin270]HPW44959.1 phosphate/phosphite/phosphonate ABC transporter substrate-binding protein [bacterium]HQC50525.1 phosphate/phosphite/phosphonate ABC transporter substrate-binding protein [bacterium]HQG13394.1 phosphate/phosphite/phosphonate ABC transporter substrate-binding protein [bacterium]
MKIAKTLMVVMAVVMALGMQSCDRRRGEVGSSSNPVRFYFMPLKGTDLYKQYAPVLEKYIEANSGLSVETIEAPDFITIIKNFGEKKADIAFINTLGYLMAHDWAKAEAYLQMLYDDVYRTYRGEILVRADSEINDISDLNGKKIAFADPFSAGGYLYPLKLLNENKVKVKDTVFAGGHLKGIEMLYNGQVDAAATYHSRPGILGEEKDARIEFLKKYPDIMTKIKILALTDEIPNGPVTLRKDLPEDVKAKLVGAVISFAKTPEGRDALLNLYNVTGLALADNANYDDVRETLKELGKSIDEVVPGGITFYRKNAEAWLEY